MTTKKKKSKAKPKSKSKANAKVKAKGKAKSKANAKAKATGKGNTKTARPAPAKVTPALKRRALDIVKGLREEYPDAHCELDFTNGLELLIGTILAAQCTDKRVNQVTKGLFSKYRTAQDYVDADEETLKEEIRSTGFFNNKTKSIKKATLSIVEKFGGELPDTMLELLELAGVGRKSANVLMVNVYDQPGIVVDTHMLRITKRMGLTTNTDAVKVEFDIRALLPEEDWGSFSKLIPWHGRRLCPARKPACDDCPVGHVCPKLL